MRTDSCSPIPRLIHQTWKTRDLPPEFQALQRSWIERNPGFEYRFWTDGDIGRFIAEEHSALLPVFHGYADPIARIDLARYLILRRFGGVYADLDFECLRPIDGLLEGRSFVVGLEPEEHGGLAKAVERGLPRILCPSFLASVPGHPFWDHLLDRLVEARSCADVLDATGPFLLTRAHASYEGARHEDGAAAVTVLPPELLYPVTKEDCWSGRLFDPVFWEQATRRAYAVHYWEGTWFRGAAGRGAGPEAALPRQVAAVVTDGRPEGARSPIKSEGFPLISCLMVTRGQRAERGALLEFAIDGFARQTYPNRELVVVCDSPALPQDDPLERAIRAAGSPNIRLIRVDATARQGGATLGELRNIAVDHAAGRYVCQWDDDDLYDPCRLEMQQRVLAAAGAQACLLGRWMIWWPAEDRLAVSSERDWEGSLLCEKAVMPRYPALRRGEDTPVVEQLRRSVRVVRMDLPRLYTYVVHGGNTFAVRHFEAHWQVATARFTGDRCRAVLEEMGKRLPVEAYRRAVAPVPAAPDPATVAARQERVLVLTPVKDAVADADPISRPAVSVIVCTYRRPELLDLCLASLVGQATSAGRHEILVVDNAPQLDARPVVERWQSAFRDRGVALRHVVEARTGVAFARNRGLAEATAPLIAFIDDDERACPGWLEALTAPFATFGDAVDIVAGEVEPDFADVPRPDWLGDDLLHIYSCRWGWDTQSRFLKPAEWFGEGNCAFRKRLLDGKGFAIDLGRRGDNLMSSEGILFVALRAAGAGTYYVPEAQVTHHIHRDRLDRKWVLRRMFFQGNSDYIAHRHYGLHKKPQEFSLSLEKLMALDVELLDSASLKAVSGLYYHLGYAAASNMY